MPSLYLHLGLAWDIALHLDVDKGYFLFGSTLPDIHLLTTLSREETHFYRLGMEPEGKALIPSLRQHFGSKSLLGAGYLSHLVSDIIWVKEIYRPFFSAVSPLKDDPFADLLDRTLQYELDIKEREDKMKASQIRQALANLSLKETMLIKMDDLKLWHNILLSTLRREASWEGFPHFVYNLLRRGRIKVEKVSEFLSSLSQMRERVLKYVPQDKIISFREKAIEASISAIGEYLAKDL